MRMFQRSRTGIMAAGMSCLLAGYALAQQIEPGQPGVPTQPRTGEPRTAGASSDVDRYLASCWQGKNQAEIELSQIAQRQGQNPQVREFAQTMVQEHSELSRKLQPLAGGQFATTGNQPGQPRQPDQPGIPGSPTLAQGAQGGDQAINRLIQIDRKITERTTEAMKQKLEEKSGAQFDRCYMAGQVACHLQASAALEVISQQSTGQLQQLAREAKQKVDQHLRQAEQLAEQLERSGQRAASRPQASTGARLDRNLRPAGAERE